MSFLGKRTLPLVSPFDQIAELSRRKKQFGSLLKGNSISAAKSYFDSELLPYLGDVFYLPVSENDFYSRALSTDPSDAELAIRLLRHADRFGKDEVFSVFLDSFEGDQRFIALHFNFSRSVTFSLGRTDLDLAERLFEIYDKIGYLAPRLFAAYEISRVYYGLYCDSKNNSDHSCEISAATKVLYYLRSMGDDSLVHRAQAEFRLNGP